MTDETHDALDDLPEGDSAEESIPEIPVRDWEGDVHPHDVNPEDRFTVNGTPLSLDEFAEASLGELVSRPRVDEEEQPPVLPLEVIWRARREAENPAEADWVEPEPVDDLT
jgi:hypothetical protein